MSIYEFPKTEIRNTNGIPQVFVNGSNLGLYRAYVASESYFCMGKEDLESVKNFYDAGFRQFNVLFFPNIFWRDVEVFDYEKCFEHLEDIVNRILSVAPDAFILIRWSLFVPQWWCEKFQDETFVFSEKVDYLQNQPGGKYPASYASKVWRSQQAQITSRLFEMIKTSPVAQRIMGFRLAYGNCGEWNSVGYLEKLCADFSKPTLAEFRQWLYDKYKTNEELAASWNIKKLIFESVCFPDKKQRLDGDCVFRTQGSRQVADYYLFWQHCTVSTIEYFAKLFKELSGSRCLVGTFYGYFLTHMWQGPYHSIESGHYGLMQSINSEYIDFVGGPYPYNDRREYAPINAPSLSVNLHNKIWDTENDQRTHLCHDIQKRYGKTHDLNESVAIAIRDFANNTVKGCHSYFYDFANGWYNNGKFMNVVKRLKEIDNILIDKPLINNFVAVFICESTMSYVANDCGAMKALSKTLMCELDAAGTGWDMYMIDDIGRVNLDKYKLIIIANSYFMSEAIRCDAQKLKEQSNKTIMYMYGVSVVDDQCHINTHTNKSITGFETKMADDAIGEVVWDDCTLPHTDVAPWFEIKDDEAEVLAVGGENNKIVIARKTDKKNLTEIFCAAPWLDRYMLRKVYDIAGVHICSRNDGLFFTGKDILCLYSRHKGCKQIVFDKKHKYVVNLIEKTMLRDCSAIEIDQAENVESFLYYAGDDEAISQKFMN